MSPISLLQTGSHLLPEGRELHPPPPTDEKTQGPRNSITCLRTESLQVAEARLKHTRVRPSPSKPPPLCSFPGLPRVRQDGRGPWDSTAEGWEAYQTTAWVQTLSRPWASSSLCPVDSPAKKGKQRHPFMELWWKLQELIQTWAQHVEALGRKKL